MSTAQRQRQAEATTIQHDGKSVLEAAIDQTPKSAGSKTVRQLAAEFLAVPVDKVCDLLRNCWRVTKGEPELTDQELFMGVSLIARYGLDPVTREVYVTRGKDGRLMTIVGIDGWIKILHRTPDYDGFTVDMHADDKGVVDWVDTTIYSKTKSHPTTYRAFDREYAAIAGYMRGKLPTHMLRLFSLRHAARLFTPLGGAVMLQEEADFANANPEPHPAPASLDSLTSALAPPPVAEAATEPEPDSGQAFADYLAGLERCKSAASVKTLYDAIFGEGRTVEWTPAENEAAFAAAEKRTQELKGGGK